MKLIRGLLGMLRGKASQQELNHLYFKDDRSAFEYACKYQRYELIKDKFLPCLVEAVSTPADGKTVGVIKIPHDGEEVTTIATFLSSGSHHQLEGTLCVAVVDDLIESVGVPALMVVAQLNPEWDVSGWKIKHRL